MYDDFLRERGGGLHHLVFNVLDLDSILLELAKNGIPVVQSGKRKGLKWTYIEMGFRTGPSWS